MASKKNARKGGVSETSKRSASRPRHYAGPGGNVDLTEKQALALWELVLTGDGKAASQRAVELAPADVKHLTKAGLVTVENGPRPKQPKWMATLHLTDAGWAWATQQGLAVWLPTQKATAFVLEALLDKVGKYLAVRGLALDDLLRPKPAEPTPSPTLDGRIREAYRQITGGIMNESIKLSQLRKALGAEPREAVDEELRQMQQRGDTVLYPIDDPFLLRPEDEAAALRVAGQRRDLVCIRS